MKLETLQEADLSKKEVRLAVQQGNISKSVAFKVSTDLAKIIKKHINTDWKYSKQYLDQGIEYIGEDTAEANKVVDIIIGDIYGYFSDGNRRDRSQVKDMMRAIGEAKQKVYYVNPVNEAKPQIEFFKFLNKPAMGININKVK